ncbi:hypothetical protein [Rhodococcus sp. BP22]|uniref:hypothetical protein n=1 Tax=Rhodococcus sp. BP22 TaxID=2758566 RepID=UPI00164656B6|nr:hypothetical protein [Rhodococcus sp. BP22]
MEPRKKVKLNTIVEQWDGTSSVSVLASRCKILVSYGYNLLAQEIAVETDLPFMRTSHASLDVTDWMSCSRSGDGDLIFRVRETAFPSLESAFVIPSITAGAVTANFINCSEVDRRDHV